MTRNKPSDHLGFLKLVVILIVSWMVSWTVVTVADKAKDWVFVRNTVQNIGMKYERHENGQKVKEEKEESGKTF